ncbi:hypothetical protein EGW08_018054 [Elysia chlorotica]|uniref:Lipocalin/cytosolic fatty-acid binding domain-containing protein n=1 Tax=Elysia chlorotica TaxID=188477 RepID=A0A3S1B7Y3_ELYCH|nr:hypothetical protein EGW08_018054 [Elysia chlorotica]
MENVYGKWKVAVDRTTGVAEIGKLFGWTEEKQKMFSSLEYTMLLEASGDKHRCYLDYGAMTMEFLFKLGEPFDYTGADGTKAKCTVTLQGDNKLVDRYRTPEGASWQTVREVDKEAGTMKTTTTFDGFPDVACVQQLVKL